MTDDGCTDGTIEAVRDKFHDVRIVKGDGSLFWNRGMLKAWEAASTEKSYDYYIWLNDDTIIKPQTIIRQLLSVQLILWMGNMLLMEDVLKVAQYHWNRIR